MTLSINRDKGIRVLFLCFGLIFGILAGKSMVEPLPMETKHTVEHDRFNTTNSLDVLGTIQTNHPVVGDVEIRIVDEIKRDAIGRAYLEKNIILIENGMSTRQTEHVCDHEMTHLMYDYLHDQPLDRSEDPVYLYSDDQDILLCDNLALYLEQQSE